MSSKFIKGHIRSLICIKFNFFLDFCVQSLLLDLALSHGKIKKKKQLSLKYKNTPKVENKKTLFSMNFEGWVNPNQGDERWHDC